MASERNHAVRELLAFYQEAGVDALVGEAPVDRFADPDVNKNALGGEGLPASTGPGVGVDPATVGTRPMSTAASAPKSALNRARPAPGPATFAPPEPPPSPEAAVMAAREAARSAGTLDELRAILNGFEGCALRKTATQLVFA